LILFNFVSKPCLFGGVAERGKREEKSPKKFIDLLAVFPITLALISLLM
jgi:hypothetical protein